MAPRVALGDITTRHNLAQATGVAKLKVMETKQKLVEGRARVVEGRVREVEGRAKVVKGRARVVEGRARLTRQASRRLAVLEVQDEPMAIDQVDER